MIQIIKQISNHPVLLNPDGSGKKRAIRVKEIEAINFDIHWARVKWEELFLDNEDNPIDDETVPKRLIVSVIDNNNKVTEQGIVIDSENFPKLEEESDDDYNTRIQTMKDNGFPEFDFYVGMILNKSAILQAIDILDSLNRFNRK